MVDFYRTRSFVAIKNDFYFKAIGFMSDLLLDVEEE